MPSRCKTPLLIRRTIEIFVLYSYYDPLHSETPPLGVWTCTDVSPTKIDGSQIRVLQNTPFLSNPARDRIAPDFTIRHPVYPIVALQRRVRFSARLAGFCRGRCHQRRARRAELASFSAFVSNLDFRVPRLRQRGKWAAGRAVRPPKRGHPRDPESRPGLSWRSWHSTFWSRCAWASLMPSLASDFVSTRIRQGSRGGCPGRC